MTVSPIRIAPLGDTLATVTVGEGVSLELSANVVARSRQILAGGIIGVTDVVPAYAAVGIHYDPRVIGFQDLHDRLMTILAVTADESGPESEARVHQIPLIYNGVDLADVAARTGMSEGDVIEAHAAREYHVFVIGFVPGFAYLGPLDDRLALPRRDAPRKQVPAGSVAIADRQTAVYPSVTPGGWHLIGTADVSSFDPAREQPSLFRVGDRVRFVPQ